MRALPQADAAAVLYEMGQVRAGGLSAARHLKGPIWEVRADGTDSRYRVLFAPEGRRGQVLLSLHAFKKQTQKTPRLQIELAEQRLADWRGRGRANGPGRRAERGRHERG
jgi:phage-related protein